MSTAQASDTNTMSLLYLDPRQLEADPNGIREEMGDIAGLASTIAEQGLLQPLGVVRTAPDQYRIVYGGRRHAAAIYLGLDRVACILMDAHDPFLLDRQIIENVQRQQLSDLEEARAILRLRQRTAELHTLLTEGELDERVGRAIGLSGRTVRRYLSLLELPVAIQDFLKRGDLNMSQAQHLRRISNEQTQLDVARAAVDEGLTAADLNKLAAYFVEHPDQDLDSALRSMMQGEEAEPPRLQRRDFLPEPPPMPSERLSAEKVTAPWDELDEDDEEDEGEDELLADNSAETDRARTMKLNSLDHMVDETDRLLRACLEGDLKRWLRKDEGAPYKTRLLVKQLEGVLRALREMASSQGWSVE